jgi:hypothetical protein
MHLITMIKGDIDIDLGNRDTLLKLIPHIPASIRKDTIKKHPTGVYVTNIPYDSVNEISSLDYEQAEFRGYFKLDILNVHIYNQIKNEEHLLQMMKEPDWSMLDDPVIVEKLIHIGNHYQSIRKMPEPINSIPRLAMFLAVIRPGKKHLIGLPWQEVAKTIWDKEEGVYSFKKSHAVAYAQLVVVNMNLLKYGTETT